MKDQLLAIIRNNAMHRLFVINLITVLVIVFISISANSVLAQQESVSDRTDINDLRLREKIPQGVCVEDQSGSLKQLFELQTP